MIEGQNLDQAKRHPDVVKNIIKKDGRKGAIPYSSSNPPPYPVTSVNGQEGDVLIPQADTSSYGITKLSSATNSTAEDVAATPKAVKSVKDMIPAASSATPQNLGTAAAGSSTNYSRADHVHNKPTYTKSDVGLGNVANVLQYSASNPPPYPVTKVNNKTGAVSLTASDVGAVAKTGDTMSGALTVSSGNITASAGSVIAGTDGNTAAERQISCRSGAGTVYLYSQASTTGSRGLYVPAHGTGAAKAVISIDTNNNCSFNGNAATATKATQDADGNDIRVKYFNVYNTNNVNKSSTLTLNDLAKQGWAGGMFNPATDNPRGAAGWTLAYTASWAKNQNTDWVWQIANQPRNGGFGTERMWYRSTQGGGITGQGWVTLQDSKLLWTNASPNADFAAQKVSLTLNGFDAVKIVFCPFGGSDAATGVVEIPVGRNGNLFYMYFNTSTTGSAIAFLNGTSRTCYVATDGVTFSAGQMVYNNGVYTNWNGRSVPWKIYGVHW